ncbi:MAG TPA: right-handed parallel beta-helix repeat-containing protein [Pyrinomonadaceae bacterium]|nr:right-handed parallel beta-helix repeat-containing protein [Pyrinomonadaceae bacterium]
MKKALNILALTVFMSGFASMAQAQATRTWVMGTGDDANPCTRTAPCKTFAGAIVKTAPQGEINAVDSGGFGTVTITKSITIDGGGTLAGIMAAGSTGVVINALSTDVVTLRNLVIDGFNTGSRGVNLLSAKTLNVENCTIFRFINEGILVSETSDLNLHVADTTIRDCAGDGISASTTSASLRVRGTLDKVRLSGNGNGLHARSGSSFTARNSVFSNNTNNGIFCDALGVVFAGVSVWESQISGNGANGVRAGNTGNVGGSGVQIAQNQIDNNVGNGVLVSTGGVVNTFTNNSILANGVNGCPSCSNAAPGN